MCILVATIKLQFKLTAKTCIRVRIKLIHLLIKHATIKLVLYFYWIKLKLVISHSDILLLWWKKNTHCHWFTVTHCISIMEVQYQCPILGLAWSCYALLKPSAWSIKWEHKALRTRLATIWSISKHRICGNNHPWTHACVTPH